MAENEILPAGLSGLDRGLVKGERQAAAVRRFLDRMDQLRRNFSLCCAIQQSTLGFNASLAAAKRSLNQKTRKRPARRVDPQLETYIGARAMKAARHQDPNAVTPTPDDVNAAATEAVATFKPVRGRPAHSLLAFHVHAFMALYRQTCGEELRASLTRNSVYDPHFHSRMGDMLLTMMREGNPAVTMTQLVNIVLDAHAAGTTSGRRFESYFPFQLGIDWASGVPEPQPGFRLEQFEWLPPIYSS